VSAMEDQMRAEIESAEQEYDDAMKKFKKDSKKFKEPIHWLTTEANKVEKGEADAVEVAKHFLRRKICKENRFGPYKNTSLPAQNTGAMKRGREDEGESDTKRIKNEGDVSSSFNNNNNNNGANNTFQNTNGQVYSGLHQLTPSVVSSGRSSPTGRFGHHPLSSTGLLSQYQIIGRDVINYLDVQLPPFTCPKVSQRAHANLITPRK
jgi:hypothetical protein